MKITKKGDDGTTQTGRGRQYKNSANIVILGEIDHLNSHIAVLKQHHGNLDLEIIQNHLYMIMSDYACWTSPPRFTEEEYTWLDATTDKLASTLDLKEFQTPGKSIGNAHYNVCRTQTRRIEPLLFGNKGWLNQEQDDLLMKYFNRLSSYFFVMGEKCV